MNEEISRNDRIQRIFEHALDLPTDRRQPFLSEQCGGDEKLRQEVDSLLDAHANAGTFMQSPTAEPATVSPSEDIREQSGSIVDRYKLLEEIGVGGFGVVFMAQQTKPIRRRVALKIIKLGMDTKQVVARFEAERQALAMMDHPNIARVLDGGATDAGRPYFVMELVRGDPITDYCDREKLTMRDRLELFNQVCNAVQHAHQKGIIHRDIKPSNVLVTVADGKPMVKVIDFGIAKATNSELTEKTLFTEFRQLIGTPQYMSPEQAERSGVDVDTRSDIYSLGILLYEMLTGRTPVDAKELQLAGWGEMQKIIREQEATLPSVLVSSKNDSSTNFAKRLGTEPARLGVLLKGDLDWIVLKAIEKDRNRRYATASQLADDIDRYLNDEPVLATPPSTPYRLMKFYKRNRRWITAASIGIFALLIGLIATSVTSVWAMKERNKSVLAEQSTRREKDRAVVAEALAAKEAETARRMAMLAGSPLISDKEAQQLGDQWKADIDDLKTTEGADDIKALAQECQYVSWLFTRGKHEETLKKAEELIPRGRKILGTGNASFLSLITTYATVKINFGMEQLPAAKWVGLYEEMIESLVLVRGEEIANPIRLEYMVWKVKAKALDNLDSVVDHYLKIQARSSKPLDRLEFARLRLATNALAEWRNDHPELYERMMALRRANGGQFNNPLATPSPRLAKDLERLQGKWESAVREGEGDTVNNRIQYKFEKNDVTVTTFLGVAENGSVRESRITLDTVGPLTVLSVVPKDPMPGEGQLLVYRFENEQLVTIDGLADVPGEKPPLAVRRWTKIKE